MKQYDSFSCPVFISMYAFDIIKNNDLSHNQSDSVTPYIKKFKTYMAAYCITEINELTCEPNTTFNHQRATARSNLTSITNVGMNFNTPCSSRNNDNNTQHLSFLSGHRRSESNRFNDALNFNTIAHIRTDHTSPFPFTNPSSQRTTVLQPISNCSSRKRNRNSSQKRRGYESLKMVRNDSDLMVFQKHRRNVLQKTKNITDENTG